MFLNKYLAIAGLLIVLNTNAFAITSESLCNNFTKSAHINNINESYQYLQTHKNDFLANFCYGVLFSEQKHPFTNINEYLKNQNYPVQYYIKATTLTNNPTYKTLAYMRLAEYYANNNGYPATQLTLAKTYYYINLGLESAMATKNNALIKNMILEAISYGDPLKMDEYILAGEKYFTTNQDKSQFYSTLANRFEKIKDYNKALYYRLQEMNEEFALKSFYNIVNGTFYSLKNDIFNGNNINLTQQSIKSLISIAEYLQNNSQKTEKFNGTVFTYGTFAGTMYQDIGDLLYQIGNYKDALLNYKASYALYMKEKQYEYAKQTLIKIQNTEKLAYPKK